MGFDTGTIKKAVILGAGKTGRGYLARILAEAGVSVTFIEENQVLVESIKQAGGYTISFFGNQRLPVRMEQFRIFSWKDSGAEQSLREADLICTAIGADRLAGIITQLQKNVLSSGRREADRQLLLVCENGIHPSRILYEELGELYTIAEGIVFCTTTEDGLNIWSQDMNWIPYDGNRISWDLELPGFEKEPHFSELLKRKIYTYNCLSACICYFGAERNYKVFAEAAVDAFVQEKIEHLRGPLNRMIAKEYKVSEEEQKAFFEQAYKKFVNPKIVDSVSRNGRNVRRKLGEKERLIGPLRLAVKYGEPREEFERLIVSALCYGKNMGEFQIQEEAQVEALLREVAGIQEQELLQEILSIYPRNEYGKN